jgi:nicotinamide riboside transporter PnuC
LRAWHKPTDISPCYLIINYTAGFYGGLGTTLFLFALDVMLVCETTR